MRKIIVALLVVIAVLISLLAFSLHRPVSPPESPQPFPAGTQWTEVIADPTIRLVHVENYSYPVMTYNVTERSITMSKNFDAAIAWGDHGYTNIVAYHPLSNGATLVRVEDATKRIVYSTSIYGVGPIDHSQYSNRVSVFTNHDLVMIIGVEGAGNYREIRRIVDGSLVAVDQSFNNGWRRDAIRVE